MEYRQLGTSPVKASVITFGAWAIGGWMWGGADRRDAVAAIKAAYDNGVTSIDTAPAYGQGLSEEIVAEALQGIPRDRVQILTKFGLRWDVKQGEFFFKSKDNNGHEIDMYKLASKESVIKECEDCLRRLKTDYIDLFQIHWHDSTTPIAETMEALLRLQEQGKIRAAGVCNYSKALMQEAERTINLASDQVPYSMVNRGIEKELVPYSIDHNKAIIAYSPLQRGLLTGKIKPGHQFSEGDSRAGVRFYVSAQNPRVRIRQCHRHHYFKAVVRIHQRAATVFSYSKAPEIGHSCTARSIDLHRRLRNVLDNKSVCQVAVCPFKNTCGIRIIESARSRICYLRAGVVRV